MKLDKPDFQKRQSEEGGGVERFPPEKKGVGVELGRGGGGGGGL